MDARDALWDLKELPEWFYYSETYRVHYSDYNFGQGFGLSTHPGCHSPQGTAHLAVIGGLRGWAGT